MLIKSKEIKGYKLHSLDGEIGKIKEFYFDDHYWTIRYLVVDTGNWLIDRQVLISPYALADVNKEEQYITINLTKKQIEESPSLDFDKPVSQQFEESYYEHYGWPIYWGGESMWGFTPYIAPYPYIVPEPKTGKGSAKQKKAYDHHLRSTHEVVTYEIQATDGEIGHVSDFIIDDETWAIRYLIIDTRNWWPGKNVLISPQWIERISWQDAKVFVNLLREAIMQSPEYTEESLLTREYEAGLQGHYNCKGYWVDEPVSK